MKASNGSLGRGASFKCAVVRLLGKLRVLKAERVASLLDYITVENSDLFDAAWYLRTYPDVKRAGFDPVWHYCRKGWREGRAPSPAFDGKDYLRRYPDVRKTGMNPLVHYLRHGMEEKRPFLPAVRKIWTLPAGLDEKYCSAIERACPLVSVVVASYNYAELIGETLDSVLAQTYRNFEVIVVDDGSSDESVEVIGRYVRKHKNVKLYTHEGGVNKGLPATVKLGIEKASGEYVAFCESDDILEPTNIEEKMLLVKRFNGEPNIIVNDVTPFGNPDRLPNAVKIIDERMREMPGERNVVTPLQMREKNMICTFSCCMVRRSVLQSCDFDGLPRPANLDWWLWRQVCCENPVFVVHKKLTRWRLHNSFMTKESAESIARQREFLEKMDALLVKRYPEATADLKPLVDELARYEVRDGKLCENGVPLAEQPFFSIIMPTYNRKFCISKAIDSALAQTYGNFELIIVDDGSTDGTEEFLRGKYANELANGRMLYKWKENSGVCRTRNAGLRMAKGEWIAYIDSDNEVLPFFLEVFARAIIGNPGIVNMYAKQVYQNRHCVLGEHFDLEKLLDHNFIDLGVYVHRRSLIDELGPFDENMTRLVDWELIIRQTKKYTPMYIETIVMLYNDSSEYVRITNSARFRANINYVKRKHCNCPVVTTVITAFNHRPYLKRAIESAIMQRGKFIPEIIVADDCSTDGTAELLEELKQQYPEDFTVLPTPHNLGIAENMRRCFAAAKGKYIAILEGDDYWITPWKLNRQVRFMEENPDCSMAFSRIKLLDEKTGKLSLLPRQNGLKSKLTGDDFIKDPNQNLIANFSCCIFVASLVKNLPEEIYAYRLNEISMSFYLEQKGPIGFQPDIMTVYRIHDGSTWSRADKRRQLMSGIRCREVALQLCAPKYRDGMMAAIEKRKAALEALGDD